MCGQVFGIHQCLCLKLAWTQYISCQSCHNLESLIFIIYFSGATCLLSRRKTTGPASPDKGVHHTLQCHTPPESRPEASLTNVVKKKNKHHSCCSLTWFSPEKAVSLHKGFSVGISLLKTINIIRNLLPL